MEKCDIDGNGFLDYTEFLIGAVNWQNTLSNERLFTAFKLFDKDGDGKISLSELKETLGMIDADQESEFFEIMNFADSNHDGLVDFEEFKEMMKMNKKQLDRI